MRYVSDSKKDKQGKRKRPNLPNVKPSRAVLPVPKPIVTERDGVKVNISSAIKNAGRSGKPPKEPIDREQVNGIIIKLLIAVAIALVIAAVMFLVYYFAQSGSEDTIQSETFEGFPALVGGINIEAPPTTVASLSPMLTDLCDTLPVGEQLTAVSSYCNNPNELPTVGTPLLPDIDGIIELDPEYLITLTPLTLRQKISLEQTGTKVLEFEMPTSVSGFKDLSSELATLFLGKVKGPTVGGGIYDRFSDSLNLYANAIDSATEQRPSYSLLFDLSGYSATADTLEAQIFSSILGSPAATGQGYATTLEQIVDADPEVLILPNSYTMEDLSGTGLDVGTAAQNSNIYFIEISELETFRPTMLFDLAKIAASVYPELGL